MTRKQRSRKKPARRRRKSASPLAKLGGAVGRTTRDALSPVGWTRFALGILIGGALGVAAALIPDWPIYDRPGSVDKVIAAPSPESHDPSTGARMSIEMPQMVDSAAAAPQQPTAPMAEESPPMVEEGAPPEIKTVQAAEAPVPQPAKQQPAAKPAAMHEASVVSTAQAAETGGVDVYPAGGPGDAAWLRNSIAFSVPRGHPVIAIVLDDVGVNRAHAEAAINLPAEITLSFMTYADGVAGMAARAHARGHELMVHVPMEPLGGKNDPGPNALMVDLSDAEILRRLRWGLDRFGGYVGINNHMGSRFTQDDRGMRLVMEELQRRHLLFLDSRTIANSVGERIAEQIGVAHVTRDVFLDDDMSGAAVVKQLEIAERVARETGQVIAIGHPHPATIAAIKAWLPRAKAQGFIIAPLSVVAKRQIGVTG